MMIVSVSLEADDGCNAVARTLSRLRSVLFGDASRQAAAFRHVLWQFAVPLGITNGKLLKCLGFAKEEKVQSSLLEDVVSSG